MKRTKVDFIRERLSDVQAERSFWREQFGDLFGWRLESWNGLHSATYQIPGHRGLVDIPRAARNSILQGSR